MVEAFRQLKTCDDLSDEAKKQEIIRQTMAQMMADFDIDFNTDGLEQDEYYQEYLSSLREEFDQDYEEILVQERIEEELLEADLELEDSVPCFACQKSQMTFDYDASSTKITCGACTFAFLITGHILPDQLNDRMEWIRQQHSAGCRCVFHFEPQGEFDRCQNLRILCNVSCQYPSFSPTLIHFTLVYHLPNRSDH